MLAEEDGNDDNDEDDDDGNDDCDDACMRQKLTKIIQILSYEVSRSQANPFKSVVMLYTPKRCRKIV